MIRLVVTLAYVLAATYGATRAVARVGKTLTITPASAASYLLGCLVWSLAVVFLYVSGADA